MQRRRSDMLALLLCCIGVCATGSPSALADASMAMGCGYSVKTDAGEAITESIQMMNRQLGGQVPKLVTVATTGQRYDESQVFSALKSQVDAETRIWGLNSDSVGVAVPEGIKPGITLTGFCSSSMTVGVGSAAFDWQHPTCYREAGKTAIAKALADAGKDASDPPKIVFFAGLHLLTMTEAMRGVEDVIGDVPMWGGNTGAESGPQIMADGWCFDNEGAHTNTLVVAAIWTDTKVGVAYGYGYSDRPECKAVATKADFETRLLYELDGRPAADVYNEWVGGAITSIIEAGGGNVPVSIAGKYLLKKPLGSGEDDYVLVGPLSVEPDKSLFVANEGVPSGAQLSLSEFATEDTVVHKPALTALLARARARVAKDDIAGALLVICYAQHYTAQQHNYDVAPAFSYLSKNLGGAPFTGVFLGGEIGHSPKGGNRMMAFSTVVVVFGKS